MTDEQIKEMHAGMLKGMVASQEKISMMNEAEATFRAQAAKETADRETEMSASARHTHEKLGRQMTNMLRPTAMLRPNVLKVEDGWEASFGEVVGTGPSPELACQDFDRRWLGKDEI